MSNRSRRTLKKKSYESGLEKLRATEDDLLDNIEVFHFCHFDFNASI